MEKLLISLTKWCRYRNCREEEKSYLSTEFAYYSGISIMGGWDGPSEGISYDGLISIIRDVSYA